MSTLELENIKHPDNAGNNITLAADGTIGGINITGNVGIGTTSPSSIMELNVASGNLEVKLNGATATHGIRNQADGSFGHFDYTNSRWLDLRDYASDHYRIFTGGTERMRIDSVGRVTMPNQPKFLVGFTTTGQISVPDANVIPFNYTGGQGTFDVGSNFNTSTSRFTAPVAGHYFLQANITAVTSSTVSAQIMKNGAGITNGGDTMASFINGINNSATMNTTLIVYLAVGDYVDARTRNATYNVYKNHTWFLGYLIG